MYKKNKIKKISLLSHPTLTIWVPHWNLQAQPIWGQALRNESTIVIVFNDNSE